MAGNKYRICAVIVNNDLAVVKAVEPLVDLFEVRIDLIGSGWKEVIKHLKRPWIACNRKAEEGGQWRRGEPARIEELLAAIELGPRIVDIELSTEGVETVVQEIKGRADCLLSYHDLNGTPSLESMREMVKKQLSTGADICKVITTASSFKDNLTTLQLIAEFPETRLVSFAMGPQGQISRVLSPLAGGYFTYASIEEGGESAPGQITAAELKEIFRLIKG